MHRLTGQGHCRPNTRDSLKLVCQLKFNTPSCVVAWMCRKTLLGIFHGQAGLFVCRLEIRWLAVRGRQHGHRCDVGVPAPIRAGEAPRSCAGTGACLPERRAGICRCCNCTEPPGFFTAAHGLPGTCLDSPGKTHGVDSLVLAWLHCSNCARDPLAFCSLS